MKVQTECAACTHQDESGNSFDGEGFCGRCRGEPESISFAEYLGIKAAHATGLKWIGVSPLYYQWKQKNDSDSDQLRVGRASHTLTLEPEKFNREFVVWQGGRRQGGAWERFKSDNPCRAILTQAQYDNARQARDAVLANAGASAILAIGDVEKSIQWTDPETGMPCKARLDHVRAAVTDLKTTADPSPEPFTRTAFRLDYLLQMAWYRDGWEHVTGERLPAKIIAVGSKPPYDVVVYDLPEHVLEFGRVQYQSRMRKLVECLESNTWPGVAPGGAVLEIPAWATIEEAPLNLTFDGQSLAL